MAVDEIEIAIAGPFSAVVAEYDLSGNLSLWRLPVEYTVLLSHAVAGISAVDIAVSRIVPCPYLDIPVAVIYEIHIIFVVVIATLGFGICKRFYGLAGLVGGICLECRGFCKGKGSGVACRCGGRLRAVDRIVDIGGRTDEETYGDVVGKCRAVCRRCADRRF